MADELKYMHRLIHGTYPDSDHRLTWQHATPHLVEVKFVPKMRKNRSMYRAKLIDLDTSKRRWKAELRVWLEEVN